MSAIERQSFLKEYTDALREGTAALFVGAGVSQAAGYVNWKELLREIATDLDLDIDRESDLVALAQYHVNHRGGRQRISQLLIDEFLEDVELTESHRLIASLPVHCVWTTNYDDLLEVAFTEAGKRQDVKRRSQDFQTTRRRSDVVIYKMHGDKTEPAAAVLTKDDYESYDEKREVFTIALKADLSQRTFLFLGFSFADPNVLYILGRMKQLLSTDGRKHFCVLKKPKPTECSEYDCKRFGHWLSDLKRYNIQPVLVDEYSEVPELLKELNRRSHLRDVFISGSAHDFAPLGEDNFRELCRQLGRELIRREFNVVSGYGLGVGGDVILGAMQTLKKNDDERLQLWPFPQEVPSGTDRAKFWTEYREKMISPCGICVVLAGNKFDGTAVVPAGGVREEVQIAQAAGKAIIPVGATGYVAKELWDQAIADPRPFLGDIKAATQLQVLGDSSKTVGELVRAVVDIAKMIDR